MFRQSILVSIISIYPQSREHALHNRRKGLLALLSVTVAVRNVIKYNSYGQVLDYNYSGVD